MIEMVPQLSVSKPSKQAQVPAVQFGGWGGIRYFLRRTDHIIKNKKKFICLILTITVVADSKVRAVDVEGVAR